MKIRDSGMPERSLWEGFFDPPAVLRRLGVSAAAGAIADLGCGYGTFSIAAAQLTPAAVHAFDIDPQMASATARAAADLGLSNLHAVERDLQVEGTGLADGSVGCVLLFNVLHAEDAARLLGEAFRILRPDGMLAIIHWVHDARTPRGPPLSIRPRPDQCGSWAQHAGFLLQGAPLALPPWHYGLVARRPR